MDAPGTGRQAVGPDHPDLRLHLRSLRDELDHHRSLTDGCARRRNASDSPSTSRWSAWPSRASTAGTRRPGGILRGQRRALLVARPPCRGPRGHRTDEFVVPTERADVAAVLTALARGDLERWEGQRRYLRPDGSEVRAQVRKGRVRTSVRRCGLPHHPLRGRHRAVPRRTATPPPGAARPADGAAEPLPARRPPRRGTGARAPGPRDDGPAVPRPRRLQGRQRRARAPGRRRILVVVGQRLRHAVRETDTAARYGGDEFVVVCEGLRDEAEAQAVAVRVMDTVTAPLQLRGRTISPRLSIGIAISAIPTSHGRRRSCSARPTRRCTRRDPAARGAARGSRPPADRGAPPPRRRGGPARRPAGGGTAGALPTIVDLRTVRSPVPRAPRPVAAPPARSAAARRVHRRRRAERPRRRPRRVGPGRGVRLALPVAARRQARDPALRRAAVPSSARLAVSVNASVRQVTSGQLRPLVERVLEDNELQPGSCTGDHRDAVHVRCAGDPAGDGGVRDLGVGLSLDDFGTGYSRWRTCGSCPSTASSSTGPTSRGSAGTAATRRWSRRSWPSREALDLHTVAEGVETVEQAVLLRDRAAATRRGSCGRGPSRTWNHRPPRLTHRATRGTHRAPGVRGEFAHHFRGPVSLCLPPEPAPRAG